MAFRTLTQFTHLMSPLSMLLFNIGFMLPLTLVLRPSLKEVLVFVLIDAAALALTFAIDKRLFLLLYPDSRLFFFGPKDEEIGPLDPSGREKLFYALVKFPKRRARYAVLLSLFKSTPGFLYVIFFFSSPIQGVEKVLLSLLVVLLGYAYFYGIIFIEQHGLVSRTLRELHRKFDWSELFRKVEIPYSRRDFDAQHITAMLAVFFLVLLLQLLLIANAHIYQTSLSLLIFAVAICGFMLCVRLWHADRDFFAGGLRDLFQSLDSFDPESAARGLPLHSSPLLARFEKTVNSLQERLQAHEREIAQWVHKRTETSRYEALGEISALVVHDLSSPLHVIHFCTDQLAENPELLTDQRYLHQLQISGKRSLDLIDSLRAYLKNPDRPFEETSFQEAYKHMLRILKTRYFEEGISKLRLEAEPALLDVKFRILRADLIHILYNLISNSVANLLENAIEDPMIRLSILKEEAGKLTMQIQDNGTGMTPEKFEELTSFAYQGSASTQKNCGLGLKLVRRLVERLGGSLKVVPSAPGEKGTRLALTLPSLDNGANEIPAPTEEVTH